METQKCSKCWEEMTGEYSTLDRTYLSPPLRLKEHHRRGGRRTLRARGGGCEMSSGYGTILAIMNTHWAYGFLAYRNHLYDIIYKRYLHYVELSIIRKMFINQKQQSNIRKKKACEGKRNIVDWPPLYLVKFKKNSLCVLRLPHIPYLVPDRKQV